MSEESFLNLQRLNGTESYSVGEGTFHIHQHETLGTGITFGIADATPIKTLEDTAVFKPKPEATATVYVDKLDESTLAGMEFSIPNAFDDAAGDHVAWFYYLSHEDVDNNRVSILAHEEDRVRFRWTGSMPEAEFEIESWANVTRDVTD